MPTSTQHILLVSPGKVWHVLLPRMQTIGPVTFIDMLTNQKKYNFSRIGQVFVENPP